MIRVCLACLLGGCSRAAFSAAGVDAGLRFAVTVSCSARGGPRSDAFEQTGEVALPEPAGGEVQCPAACVDGQSDRIWMNRRRCAVRAVSPASPSRWSSAAGLYARQPKTVQAALGLNPLERKCGF